MNRYRVYGTYNIGFEVEVIAGSEEEAEYMVDDINFWESANGGIFADALDLEEVRLSADGTVENVDVELAEEDVDEE